MTKTRVVNFCEARIVRSAAIGLLLAGSAAPAFAITTAPSWKASELIANASHDNHRGDRFMAFDHHGTPATALVGTTGSLTFARLVDGTGWRTRSLGGINVKHPSIAFDRREQPAITYGADNGLNYTYFSPTLNNWQTNLVDNTAVTGRIWNLGTSIAFDVYGRPAVAATRNDGNFGDLYYVFDSNLDGVLSSTDGIEIVTSDPESHPSLTFDPQNRPVIAPRYLSQGTFGDLDVWIKDPFTGWGLSVVSTNAEEGTPDYVNGSVAIDPADGQPAVAWSHWTGSESQLWYAKWDALDAFWNPSLVTSIFGSQLGNESLAFDPRDGRPVISYGETTGNVKLAWFNGSIWNTQTVTGTGTTIAPRTSLAFNEFGHGFPAIAYITNTGSGTGQMRFIVDPPAVVPEPAGAICLAGLLGLSTLWRQPGVNR